MIESNHRSQVGPVLQVRDLRVSYAMSGDVAHAVKSVSLDIGPGETLALVGESGSGKSTLAHAIIGLLPPGGRLDSGTIRLGGRNITNARESEMRAIRGRSVGFIPQDPGVSLNPVVRVGVQVAEAIRVHERVPRSAAMERAVKLLDRVGLPKAGHTARQFPHELSGGMRQRVLIAIAVANSPRLLVADEPTSALDTTVQRRILDQLETLADELGTAVLLITHDLGVAADRAQRTAVMSQGRIVEVAPTGTLLDSPVHPYTRLLLTHSLHTPEPATTGGPRPPAPPFHGDPVLAVTNLVKEFAPPGGGRRGGATRAVDSVSFEIHRGETLALVGESGSGKTTSAHLALRLLAPTSGTIRLSGEDVTAWRGERLRQIRRHAQIVYQNPYASLDPRFTVEEVVVEPLRAFGIGDRRQRRQRAHTLLDRVALPTTLLDHKPGELSGGQRQRVAIARALALSPDLVVLDEPVSALDSAVQWQVLELLTELQLEAGLAYLFISHDLAVVQRIAHRVAVMRAGRIIETGSTAELLDHPRHPYSQELLAAIPGRVGRQVPGNRT